LEHVSQEVRIGFMTADDFRFLRLFWETSSNEKNDWYAFSKGGGYSPFYDDLHLVVYWDGGRIYWSVNNGGKATPPSNVWMLETTVNEHFKRPGISFTRRSTSGFAPQPLPENALFSDMSPTVNVVDDESDNLLVILGCLFSRPARYLLELFAGSADEATSGSAARRYSASVVNALPFPRFSGVVKHGFAATVRQAVQNRMRDFSEDETSRLFSIAPLTTGKCLRTLLNEAVARRLKRACHNLQLFAEADKIVCDGFGLNTQARGLLDIEMFPLLAEGRGACVKSEALSELLRKDVGDLIAEAQRKGLTGRFITKKEYVGDRALELAIMISGADSRTLAAFNGRDAFTPADVFGSAVGTASFALGVALGRWDILYATGEQAAPELPDPFAPLPVCPPGQLQNAQGLPARPEDVPAAYPVRIPWDGILVDDPNHPLDIERRVREVIEIIWKDRAEAIEHEACEILGVKSLRDYFCKPAGFFADHLKRYSKSRRQAPIYWPLSTASGSYTLWIYYHRLTDQTLFQCVNDFVKPKLDEVNRDIERLRGELQRADGGSSKQRETLEELEDFTIELKEFHDELLRVAGLPYKPNLNDGVLITASPLWKLFRLPKWQKELKACWEALEQEEYEWAHLAYTIWPDRVKKVCKTDRSIAIAHGLEELCEVKAPEKKAKRGKKQADAELALEGGGE
jgi:hypothetical protein